MIGSCSLPQRIGLYQASCPSWQRSGISDTRQMAWPGSFGAGTAEGSGFADDTPLGAATAARKKVRPENAAPKAESKQTSAMVVFMIFVLYDAARQQLLTARAVFFALRSVLRGLTFE